MLLANLNFNGNLYPADAPILQASNRAFRYGDGLFESIRVFDGKMPFFKWHWQRLLAGAGLLSLELPAHFTPEFFEVEIAKLTGSAGNWRIRLSIFRAAGGYYTPAQNQAEFLIEAFTLDCSVFELPAEGLRVGIYDEHLLPVLHQNGLPSIHSIKTSNALPFVLAGIFSQQHGWDDCLLLNQQRRVACGGSSNLFLVKDGVLITPPISEGCIAGTLRSVVLEMAGKAGISCVEAPIETSDLAIAQEVFLTNAISGIRWIRLVEGLDRQFENTFSTKLINLLRDAC